MTETFTIATTDREIALNDIFTTALEGGIGYWSECSFYQWSDRTPAMNQINEFRAVITDTQDPDHPEYVIDAAVIARGIRKAYEHYKGSTNQRYHAQALAGLNFGKWDDVDYDADTADLIVQFGLGLVRPDGGGCIYG